MGVFKKDETNVAGKSASSGEAAQVSEIIEQIQSLIYPPEAVPHAPALLPSEGTRPVTKTFRLRT